MKPSAMLIFIVLLINKTQIYFIGHYAPRQTVIACHLGNEQRPTEIHFINHLQRVPFTTHQQKTLYN